MPGSNRVLLNSDHHSTDTLSKLICKLKSYNGIFFQAIIILILLSSQNNSDAAGFAVLEQSVQGLANAYAGGTAGGENISTIFYNPAGLSEYSGTEIIAGAHFVIPDARFMVNSSSDSFNRPLSGGDGTNTGENVLIPNLYLAADINDELRFGLGITVPFGLGAEFEKDWQGRYEAIDSQLQSIDINPAISYAINDKVSLGFGFSAQYIDLKLSNAIDFGSICLGQLGKDTCSEIGLTPQSADGYTEINTDGWGWGYNTGILFKPVSGLRLGIAYRSKVNYQVQGNATFQVPDSARLLTSTGAFKNTGMKAETNVPANLSVGVIFETNEKWTVLFDLTWTHWNKLGKLTTNFDNPSQPASILLLDFKNTIRTSLGVNYHINPAWTFRTGFSYDESPVRNARSRTFRIPDSDRYWLTAGVDYRPISSVKFNVGYAHIFIKDGLIERENVFGHSIKGSFESEIDIISAEFQWTF